MCGRFTLTITLEQLLFMYEAESGHIPFHLPRYNIAPGQMLAAVIHDGNKNRIGPLQWGLIPSWAKESTLGRKMINARAETLTEKPSFKHLIASKRCIVPADGFYEWKKDNGEKQPFRIRLRSKEVFGMAALYDTWRSANGEKISTCTIITTRPNRLMESIHNRMPVILDPEEQRLWLDRNNRDVPSLLSMLNSYSSDAMEAYPVAGRVGNVRHDDAELIQPV